MATEYGSEDVPISEATIRMAEGGRREQNETMEGDGGKKIKLQKETEGKKMKLKMETEGKKIKMQMETEEKRLKILEYLEKREREKEDWALYELLESCLGKMEKESNPDERQIAALKGRMNKIFDKLTK